jgi:hypothetical protein
MPGKPVVKTRVSLVLTLAMCCFLAACAAGFANPGDNPARVRVQLTADAGDYPIPEDNNGIIPLQWQWGLFLVGPGDSLTPLKPENGERLHALNDKILKRDTVFLAPPGQRRLRLLVEGYIGVKISRNSYPQNVAFLQEDITLDLKPGQTVIVKRSIKQ